MDRERIVRTVAESLVDRCIREIERDPKGGLRSLVDLGRPFVKEPYQRQYLKLVKEIEAHEDSPYYTMLGNLVKRVDHDIIKTVGLNMGLGSWSSGAKTIRRLEVEQRCHIPWWLTLHLDQSTDLTLYHRAVDQGRENGIFTYLLQVDAPGVDLGSALELIRRAPSCTFLLLAAPEDFSSRAVAAMAACHHLVPAVDTQRPGWEEAAARLESHHCLYGVWRSCGEQSDVAELLDGRWLQRVAAACCPSVVLCASALDCPRELGHAIEGYVRRTRGAQAHPLLLIDLVSDYFYVDEMISPGGCMVDLWPDGAAALRRRGGGAARRLHLGDRPLDQLWREE